jgi:antitoxin MazE
MLTRVQKWDNSLALRIPKALAHTAQLDVDSIVEVSFVDGRIIITPVVNTSWALEELLAGIHKDNIPQTINTDAVTGNEIW